MKVADLAKVQRLLAMRTKLIEAQDILVESGTDRDLDISVGEARFTLPATNPNTPSVLELCRKVVEEDITDVTDRLHGLGVEI